MKSCSAIDPTVGTTLHESMKWIYEQPNPVQVGVAPGTIVVERAALISGIVTARDSSVLPGVRVTILNHPEFGYTTSRVNGHFDMVVNGGGDPRGAIREASYLDVQRPITTVWGEYVTAPNVVMITSDPVVTPIDLTNQSAAFQVAQGSVQTDADGSRRGTVLVPSGTQATMAVPGGGSVPLAAMNVRITEFTVGDNGPDAMPGTLPPESHYTHAFEVNADEAIAAGSSGITFSTPLVYYVQQLPAVSGWDARSIRFLRQGHRRLER